MRTLRTFTLAALLLVFCLPLWASTIVFTFKVVDDTGVPVAGATLAQNTIKSLAAGTLGNAVVGLTLTPVDLGNGDYGLPYDPEGTNGEIIVNFSASKAGSTLTGQNASISVNLTKDSSRVLNADVATSTRLATTGYTAPPALPTVYPLAANDELLLGYLFNMVDPNAGTPRYKATSLALAPSVGSGANYYAPVLDSTGTTITTSLIVTVTNPTNSQTSRLITWTPDTLATTYKVMRSPNGILYTVIATVAANVTTYTDATRPSGNQYYTVIAAH